MEAVQQQQEVLLLAFTRFRDLLLKAEETEVGYDASEEGTMNGTTDDTAGKSLMASCFEAPGIPAAWIGCKAVAGLEHATICFL